MQQILPSSVRFFVHRHDDLPAFHAGYLALAFLAAALFNLGFFAVLICGHMCLDVVKYREYHGYTWSRVLEGVVRESLLDVAMLLVGFVFAVYLHNTLGLAGMTGLMRAEGTLLRFVATVLPRLTILHEVIKILTHLRAYLLHPHPRLGLSFSRREWACVIAILLSVAALVAAPAVLSADTELVRDILIDEIIPWHLA